MIPEPRIHWETLEPEILGDYPDLEAAAPKAVQAYAAKLLRIKYFAPASAPGKRKAHATNTRLKLLPGRRPKAKVDAKNKRQ